MTTSYVPVLIYFLVTMGLVAAILFLSSKIGPSRATPAKGIPYECGLDPAGSMEVRFPVRFYILAMIFIIFDVETVFLYPWAVVTRQLGLLGLIEMLIFTGVLLIGLLYIYKKDALKWE